ncbi:cytochrome P450 3A29 [Caerostris extrusa]|uniref:Cytochrome P450 3A29 n=1 Tax=Caerostris extrusa TaxID=172846 RepID=A0AAV4NQH1_CAEEX|nr:cytochrome P450 3A29 [Caerostris extrusa]
MSIFSSCSKVLVDNYSKFAEKGEPVDVKKIFGAFSMDVIANSAFSTKIDSHNDPNNAFVTAARPFFQNTVPWRLALWLVFPSIVKLFSIKVASPLSTKFFADVTLNIIKERKRTGQTRNDFLQLLIEAADEQKAEEKVAEKGDNILNNYEGETNEEVFKNFKPKKTLSSDELVAQCVIFFLAGFETTASALSFACYYLALNPAIQDKLFKELDETIRAENGMKYLDNVISETLRINPPAIRLERVASTDYKLGNTGITVPKKTCITIPVYAIHRDPKFYPEPLKFDPDR